ncbi:MAG: family 78 glycoside hydrolase catalytic domain, partial [Bacteroidetes bacterium]|nr:family 78 glycoside hydrolase catalytic domain [Bacteroidota bacterium]
MKKILIVLAILKTLTAQSQLQINNLQCEYRNHPLGVESVHPSLHWQLQSSQRNILQKAYRILVADDSSLLVKNIGNIWDSKKVNTDNSIQILYKGKALVSAKKYFWKVMIWDNRGNVSSWSPVAYWQMGLLNEKDWAGAKWIAYEKLADSLKIIPAEHGNGKKEWGKRPDILPLLRKDFSVSKKIKRATVFISGLGQFEMSINGKKVGDHFMDPGWTKYNQKALYVTFDISNYIKKGDNAIGVMLGNGFYYIPGERYRKMTGAYGYPEMIARILIEYADGSSENIVSDEKWKTTPSPITFSSLYGGENYDARLEQQEWNEPGFNDASWKNAVIADEHVLHSQMEEPIKVMQTFEPVTKVSVKENEWVYDMGQNMSGIPAISVKGNCGDTVRITTAELLNENGTANQKATGSPSYYQYILNGDGNENRQPRFAYYGFRYVQVDLLPAVANKMGTKILSVKALHTRNSAETVGAFECSNELFNKTFSLIKWAINSNMQSLFTDCPHRERLGWLEQLHLMGNAVQYNYDIHTLANKIAADIRTEQNDNGLIPSTIPEYTQMDFANGWFRDSPEWGSTAIIFPWYLYQWYGDKEELAKDYSTMQRYLDYLHSRDSSYLLMYGLSDWYDLGPERPGFCQLTPMGLTATAYYYYDLTIMQQIAKMFNWKSDVIRYSLWADSVKKAFNKKYYHPDTKQYGTGSQTSNAIALYMGLANEKGKQAIIENIIRDIKEHNYSLTSGDIGFQYLLKVLEDAGRDDIIYTMNNRSDVPGYGYQLAQGATALTESWQGLPSVSNNHFMLGHLMEWFYEGLAGIRSGKDAVAYKKIIIEPEPVG